jgi:hypothetical protein
MARYILVAAVHGTPARGATQIFPRGTTVADTEENALGYPFTPRGGSLTWSGPRYALRRRGRTSPRWMRRRLP